MTRLAAVVFDCRHAPSLARFWAAALDGYAIAPYDDAEIARLAALGLTPETDTNVMVGGPGPTLWFQQVPEAKRGKNRVHLDIEASDRGAEVARLVGLGARVERVLETNTILLDPEGNEFCVVDR